MNRIVIYGAGKIGREYASFLKSESMEHIIYAFCDRNYRQIKNIDGILVYPYEKLKNKKIKLLVAMADQEEICSLLNRDHQQYYVSMEEWIEAAFVDETERLKMLIAYRNFVWGGIRSEAVLDNLEPKLRQRLAELKLDKAIKLYGGHCPCCGRKTLFLSSHYWLRDYYQCVFCGSIPRQRALMKVLEGEEPEWRKKKIHESSPGGSTYRIFQQCCDQYTYSYWLEKQPSGVLLENGATNQNLEKMTFRDEAFDIFISQDVLEHVYEPRKAFVEICRVLKRGGLHIFTTPLYPFQKTRARIKIEESTIKHILPPIYHANPISEEGALVTYEWGYDFLEMVDQLTGMESKIVEFPNSKENFECGLEGDFLQVIVSRKI